MTKMRKRKKKVKTASTDRITHFRSRGAQLAAVLLLLAVASSLASAQEKKDYALIYGTVWGADNRAVAGVPIKILRVGDKKPKWELVSDRRGEFAQRVPTGDAEYVISADIKVPKGGTKPQTKAHVYTNERVDISLHLTE
jgi:hypothetical protein